MERPTKANTKTQSPLSLGQCPSCMQFWPQRVECAPEAAALAHLECVGIVLDQARARLGAVSKQSTPEGMFQGNCGLSGTMNVGGFGATVRASSCTSHNVVP